MAIREVSAYEVSSSYTWIFAVIGAAMLIMIVMAVYGVCRMRKIFSSRKRKLYNIGVEISLVITVLNILYWNLFMFWAL
jgi:hypothetical protein